MNPSRVAYLLKMYPRFSETFILSEILELERQGLDLRIYSLRKPDDGRFHGDLARVKAPVSYVPESLLGQPRAMAMAQRQALRLDPARYLRVASEALARGNKVAIRRFLQAGYLLPRLREAGIDHVHVHFASAAASVAYYLRRLGGPSYSITAHAKDIYHQSVSPVALRRKLRAAAFTVTVSDFNLRHLEGLLAADGGPSARLVRLYNGLDLERFRLRPVAPPTRLADAPPLILGVGRLVEKKGFDDLIGAWALVRDQGQGFRCAIVGKGEDLGALRGLIAQLGLEDLVRLPGPLPREALLELYPQAALLAAPCVIGDDGNRDGLPTVLLEAAALGVPLVSTPVTGIPELVRDGETGWLVPPRDPAALAQAMAQALSAPVETSRRALLARQRMAQAFDLRRNVTILKGLLTSPPTPSAAPDGVSAQRPGLLRPEADHVQA